MTVRLRGSITLANVNDGAVGATGPQGATGEQGPQGATGEQGPQGVTGEQGPQGATGERGGIILKVTTAPSSYSTKVGDFTPTYRIDKSTVLTQSGSSDVKVGDVLEYSYYHYPVGYVDSSYVYTTARTSFRGATGATGATGEQGPQGATGEQGPQGATGEQGPQGATGEQGPKGDTGEQGPKGDTGDSACTYDLLCTPAALVRNESGSLSPTSITFSSTKTIGSGVPSAYQGRIKIEEYNGSSWATKYTSSSNESSKAYSPTSTAKLVRGILYLAGGTTTQLDIQTVPIASDGATGATGATGEQGPQGATGEQGPQGATGEQGPQGVTGEQGPQGATGADAYTVVLGNESHTFPGGVSAAIDSSTTCSVIAFKGATQVAATIGSISGQVTGLTTSISSNGTTSAYFKVTVTTALTTTSGVLTVPITVDGKSFTKKFSWSLALKGATGATGEQGPQGATGEQGPKGATGEQGPQGATGENGKLLYGTCGTAAGTAEKAVVCTDATKLYAGLTITVKFTTANTANVPTLNVNSLGAKAIWVDNAVTSASNSLFWNTNAVITFTYDGTQFIVVDQPTTYYATSSTAAGTTAKAAACTACVVRKGTTVTVRFTYAHTGTATATLYVNGQSGTARATYLNGTAITNANSWLATEAIPFVFNGQYWYASLGAQGDTGPQGATGEQGPQGVTGPEGPKGATGEQGPQGATGSTGPTAQWYYGTALTHTSGTATLTTSSTSGVVVGAMYLNKDTSLCYKCTAISGTTATWTYAGNLTDGVIDNINVGGRNLIGATENKTIPTLSSADASLTFGSVGTYNTSTSEFSIESYDATTKTFVIMSSVTGNRGVQWYTKPGDIRADESYTFSCRVKSSIAVTIHTHTSWRNGSATASYTGWTSSGSKTIAADVWTDYSFTFKPATNAQLDWEFGVAICFTGNSNGVTFRVAHAKLERGNIVTDWTPAPEDMATTGDVAATQPLVIGTQTAKTRFWTGNCPELSSLAHGQHLTYFLPYANQSETAQSKGITAEELVPTETVTSASTNDWLKLTLADGTDTGWVPVYYQGTTRLTSHYGAGMVIPLVYREGYSSSIPRGWWGASQYYVNQIDRTQHSNTCKATATNYKTISDVNYGIVASSIIGYISDGYKTLAAGDSINLSKPILWATGDVKTSATFTNAYEVYPSCTLRNNVASWSGTTYAMAYLKGTVSGNTFTLDSTTPITSSEPQTEDGKIYIPIGQLYSAYQVAFRTCKDLYAYIDGKFRQVTPTEIVKSQVVYYRSNSNTVPTAPKTAWVTTATLAGTSADYNTWILSSPPLAVGTAAGLDKYPYLFTCTQYKRLDGTIECSAVARDNVAQVLDGDLVVNGSIATDALAANSVTAAKIDVTNLAVNGELLLGEVSATQVADGVVTFTSLQSDLRNSLDDMNETVGNLSSAIQVDLDSPDPSITLIPSSSGSGVTAVLSNNALSFNDGGVMVAEIRAKTENSGSQLYITDANVVGTLMFGGYAFIPRSNGNLSLKWIGTGGNS